jgi:hypothetical protein
MNTLGIKSLTVCMVKIINIIFLSISIYGCATIIKGYETPVELYLAPDSVQVYTISAVKIPVKKYHYTYAGVDRFDQFISLHSKSSHELRLVWRDKEKVVSVYPKLSIGWFVIDLLFGGFPLFIDMYTGAWHHFDDINAYIE